ncbi:MAG TPA: hypothetical protein PKU91_09150, partial [Phycisphaerales bacterium]|nr:hypothetical protein [Phycisphaerales bacterium]
SYHRAAIIGGPGPAQPRSIVEDGARAAWLAALEARQVLAASIELDSILNSRTWRLFDGLKRMPPFSILARMRWGPDWQRADPHEDPRSRLHRVRTSRTYRFIAASKATPLYRWYSARRHADRTSP